MKVLNNGDDINFGDTEWLNEFLSNKEFEEPDNDGEVTFDDSKEFELCFIQVEDVKKEHNTLIFCKNAVDATHEFQTWVRESRIKSRDEIAFADLFTAPDGKHLGTFDLKDDGAVGYYPALPNSKLNPYKKRHRNKVLQAIFGQ